MQIVSPTPADRPQKAVMTPLRSLRSLGLVMVCLAALMSHGIAAHSKVPVSSLDAHEISKTDDAVTRAYAANADFFDVLVHLEDIDNLDNIEKRRLAPELLVQPVRIFIENAIEYLKRVDHMQDLEITHRFRLQPTFAARVDRKTLSALLNNARISFVEDDTRWPIHTLEGIDIINADVLQFYGITGDDTAVAIIDTGIDATHPSLGGGAIPNAKVVFGLDTADNDDDPSDCIGHGTAVAAVAAGASYEWSPTRSFAGGVAPEAKIFAYKAARDDACTELVTSAVVAAIEDAVLRRDGDGYTLAAINISAGSGAFSGPCDSKTASYSQAVEIAIDAGIAVIASAGNNGLTDHLPAPACLSNVISVGSVWDTVPDDIGFCLNDDCSRVCSDINDPPLSVACYTNVSPYLDLLAPSEHLKTAQMYGQTVNFGGTSGAAPYVTGAVALMRDAISDLDPVHARLRLELTGHPVYEPVTGLLRPVIDVVKAIDLRDLGVGEQTQQVLPANEGETIINSAWVSGEGPIGNTRVVVKLVHPDPTVLTISLISPAGLRVILHDQQNGTSISVDGQNDFGGIFGVFPDTITPAESLDKFANTSIHGWWTLEIRHTSATPSQHDPSASLIGWALAFEEKTPPEPIIESTQFFPVAVRAPGAQGTHWLTDVRIFNPLKTRPATLRLYFVPQGVDGLRNFDQRDVLIHPQNTIDLWDVIATRFGEDMAQGQLIVQSDVQDVIAASRIFNASSGGGSFGQLVQPSRYGDGISADGDTQVMIQLAKNQAYRTNIGFSEITGASATVQLSLYDGDSGVLLGPIREVQVEPLSNVQLNRVFTSKMLSDVDNGYATVKIISGEGRVISYASVVDNTSGDAVFIPAANPTTHSIWMIPIVARTKGVASTNWVSDIRIFNNGDAPAAASLQFTPARSAPNTGDTIAQKIISVSPKRVFRANDVLKELFEIDSGAGSLRIVAGKQDSLVVTSRTYNNVEGGTFGQFIPAVQGGMTSAATLIHLDKNASYRSNIGLCEISGAAINLWLELYDGSGLRLGTPKRVELEPYELVQINDIFRELEAPPSSNCRLDIEVLSGGGA